MKTQRFFLILATILPLMFSLTGCSAGISQKEPPTNDNLTLGVPSKGQIIERESYVLGYEEKYEQALWVAYKLTTEEILERVVKRKDRFREDPLVVTGSANAKDYKGSGYDRGHLAPAADMLWSEKSMLESFYFSNISPQHPSLNRGKWRVLESKVRDWAVDNEQVYVFTGPIIQAGHLTIGANSVAIPQFYYKIVVDYTLPEIKAIAFILPNEKIPSDLSTYAVNVDEVESRTGFDFLSELPEEIEQTLESSFNLELWSLSR